MKDIVSLFNPFKWFFTQPVWWYEYLREQKSYTQKIEKPLANKKYSGKIILHRRKNGLES
jgi:hypothetical protein